MQVTLQAAWKLREKKNTGLRKPVMSLTIISPDRELMMNMRRFEDYVIQEVNVSKVIYDMDCDKYKFFKVIPNHKVLGRRLGAVYRGKPKDKKKKKGKKKRKQPSSFIQAINALTQEQLQEYKRNKTITVMGHEIFEGELILKEVFGTANLPSY